MRGGGDATEIEIIGEADQPQQFPLWRTAQQELRPPVMATPDLGKWEYGGEDTMTRIARVPLTPFSGLTESA